MTMVNGNATQLLALILFANTHGFLQPSRGLHLTIVSIAKNFLDPLALDVSKAQIYRLLTKCKKKKRNERRGGTDVLKLKRVHIEGFGIK